MEPWAYSPDLAAMSRDLKVLYLVPVFEELGRLGLDLGFDHLCQSIPSPTIAASQLPLSWGNGRLLRGVRFGQAARREKQTQRREGNHTAP